MLNNVRLKVHGTIFKTQLIMIHNVTNDLNLYFTIKSKTFPYIKCIFRILNIPKCNFFLKDKYRQ